MKDSLCLQPLPTPATLVKTVEKQPRSESSLLPEQLQACAASGVAQPASHAPSCPPASGTGSPHVGGMPSAAEPCLMWGAAGHPMASLAFLFGSVRSLF